MSAETVRLVLPLAAALWVWAVPTAAVAFSQIGSEDGSSNQKDGIISVPLPPLPGEITAPLPGSPEADAPQAGDAESTAGPVPNGPETEAPGIPAPAPASPSSTTAPRGTSPSAPVTVAPAAGDAGQAAPADVGTTDEGEVETPAAPGDASDAAPAASVPSTTQDDGTNDEDAPPAADPDMPAPPLRTPTAGASPLAEEAVPPARIFYGEEGLPPAVRDLRQKLLAICRTGDIEALRPYLQTGEDGTVLTFGGFDGDPITYLKSASGDGEGVEVLAILLEVLQAGHVRSEADTDNEIFIWPYFTGVPIDTLTKPQKVELFEIVTAGDYQEMLGFGAYNFYRVGISPDGKLQFFVAGD